MMTSPRQADANRRNAQASTGPVTEEGKQRSRRNALRHGLTAETIINALEDAEDYKAFEQSVAADYDAESAVERELVLRLASLLWRLRRSTSIETGLMQIEGEILREHEPTRQKTPRDGGLTALFRLRKRALDVPSDEGWTDHIGQHHAHEKYPDANFVSQERDIQSDVARHFLRVANLDNGVFERLGRYEMALWRQVRQTLFTLEGMRWRNLSARYSSQHSWRRRTETPPD